MEIDDEDLYVPEEPKNESASPVEDKPKADDLEEGEEEDEDAAMDEDDDDSVRNRIHLNYTPKHSIIHSN